MKRRSVARAGIAGGLALIFSIAPLVAAEIERSFDVGAGGTLLVEAEGTTIEIVGSGSGGARVELERRRGTGAIEDDYRVSIEQRGNDVVVGIEKRDRGLRWSWRNQGLALTVTVPERYSVDASSSGGSITVDSLVGEVDVRTSGGSIAVDDIEGSVVAKTSGGSIRVGAVTGDAEVATSGGSITVGAAQGRVRATTSGGSITIESGAEVIARTSGGSIEVREVRGAIDASTSGGTVRAYLSEQPAADCRLSSSGGSVDVVLAEDLALALDAEASGGRVSTDLPVEVTGTLSSTRLRGSLNGGGPELRLRSSGGGVRIRSR